MPLNTDKRWNGIAFLHNDVADVPFVKDGLRSCFEYRYPGVAAATSGRYEAVVLRAVPGEVRNDGWHHHEGDFHLLFILKGWIKFEYEVLGEKVYREGSCVVQPPGIKHRALSHSDDFQMFEIMSPADFRTVHDADFVNNEGRDDEN